MKIIFKTALTLLFIGSANISFAQGWPWAVKSNGTALEHSWGVATDPAGNNYMVGDYSNGTATFGSTSLATIGTTPDAYVAKANSTGVFQWAVRIAGAMSDYTQCAVASNSDVYVAGVYRSTLTLFSTTAATATLSGVTTDDECFIAKYNAAGVIQWAVSYTGVAGTAQMPRRIALNQVTSQIYVTGVTGGKMFTNCYNATSGALVWSTVSTNTGSATGWGVVSDGSASGNSFAVAQYNGAVTLGAIPSTGTNGSLLVKYDNTGAVVWVKNIGASTTGSEYPRGGLGIDGTGNLYIGGDYTSPADISGIVLPVATGTTRNFFIAKFDNSGNVLWAQSGGGSGNETTMGISTEPAGNSFLAVNSIVNNSISIDCQTFPSILGNTDNKFIVVSYDNTGAVKFAGAPFADNDQTSAWGISATGSGTAIVTGLTIGATSFGSTAFTSPNADAFLAKVGSSIPVINPVSICTGTSTTLTPTSPTGSGYTLNWWSASVGGTLLFTGPSYTTPILTSTTTYYISVAPGGCLSTRIPVTVTVSPIPIVTAVSSGNICTGSSATLTASGAASYVWMPGGSILNPLVVSPTTTTTYTVTGTTGGCSSSATVTVTVGITPTVTAVASPSTLTPPTATSSFLTSTATGGTGLTYSWSPTTSLDNPIAANPVATPTVTTTYTLTVTNSSGCSASTTVTVNVIPQSLCTLTYDYIIPSGTTSSAYFASLTGITMKNVKITGVFTIDASFNFSGCNIEMEPGSSIEVSSGAILYVTGQTHIFSCAGMWSGINLQSGSSAQIMNSSIIEDALRGVKINSGSTAQIQYAIFNKNYTAVELTANSSSTSPLSMLGCVVTCRDITFSSIVASNPLAPTIWSNILSSTYASTNMKTPFFSYKSIYGVFSTDVNALIVGSDLSSINANGFDNLSSTGVYLTRTNATIYNNNFRKITNASNCFTCTPLIGNGIYAVGNTTTNYSLKVGGSLANQPNTFTDVYTSVDATNYTNNNVLYNTITNSSTPTTTYGGYGKIGVKITPMSNNNINVSHNTITNCDNCIWIYRNNATSNQTVNMFLDYNSITTVLPGVCTNGIYVYDFTTAPTLLPTSSEIDYNTIVECSNCINLLNFKTKNDVASNSCMTRYASSGNINGIKMVNCLNQTVFLNHTKYNVGTAALSGGNPLAYGIYLQNTAAGAVRCNTIDDAASSLVFDGACTSLHGYTQNTFRRAQNGLVLLTTTTVVGVQGTTGVPSNNYWDLTVAIPNHIVNNSTTLLSLVVTSPGGSPITTIPTLFAGLGPISIATTATVSTACLAVPARMPSPEETQVSNALDNVELLIFPNPSNGSFTIETYSSEAKDIFVYDVMGKLVSEIKQTTDNTIAIDITNQPAGIYIIKVINGDSVETQRIIKQ